MPWKLLKPFVKNLQTSYLSELSCSSELDRDFVTIFYESRWQGNEEPGGKLRKGREGRIENSLVDHDYSLVPLRERPGCLPLHRDGISRHEVSSPPCASTSAPRAAPDRDFDRSRCRGPSCCTYLPSRIFARTGQSRRKIFEFSRKSRIERLNSLPGWRETASDRQPSL